MKRKRVGQEPNSREKERERGREMEHCCGRVTARVINLTIGQVIHERQRKDNPGPYQDGNKAYPKYL
jgi:hypothetical protein